MRNNAKHVLIPLTVIVIIGMGGYGVWYLVRPEQTPANRVGVIWGREVFISEFLPIYRGYQLLAAASNTAVDNQDLLRQTWRQLLLDGEARQVGIEAARTEMTALIGAIPLFQIDGAFNQELYRQRLTGIQLGVANFEEFIAGLIRTEKLNALVADSTLVSPAEVEDFYQRVNGSVLFDYAVVDSADTPAPEAPGEEVIGEYYRQHAGAYEVPPQVEISYLLIPYSRFAAETSPGAEEIEAYYRDNLSSFAEGTGEPAPLEEVRDGIADALVLRGAIEGAEQEAWELDRLFGGEATLEQAGQREGIEIETAGPFAQDGPVPGLPGAEEIAREAFRMAVGDVSFPIAYPGDAPEGIVFFRVDRKTEPRLQSLDEARLDIVANLTDEAIARATLERAQEALAKIDSAMKEEKLGFREAAAAAGLETVAAGPINLEDESESGPPANLVTVAFLTPVGSVCGQVVPLENGYGILEVTERRPAAPLPEEDRDLWKKRALQVKRSVVYLEWVRNLEARANIEAGANFRP